MFYLDNITSTMKKLIDAHCHYSTPITSDIGTGYICNSVTESDWELISYASKQNKNIFPCFGIHPWHIHTVSKNWDKKLCNLLQSTPNAMIGECGIDKTRPLLDSQIKLFSQHIQIASKYNRPLHIHCVHAWNEIFHMIKNKSDIPAIILHGFNGNTNIVNQFAKIKNVYFSYGPSILNCESNKILDSLRATPINRILIESDTTIIDSAKILINVFNKITKHIEIDKHQIYNNTTGILQHGQITQNTNVIG